MAKHTLVEEIHDRTNVRRTFREIREAVEKATTGEDLTELYKQTVYMILMTHSPPLREGDREMRRRRETAEREFSRTVYVINRRAKRIGVDPAYSEDWERMATNGYAPEGENLLEAKESVGIIGE